MEQAVESTPGIPWTVLVLREAIDDLKWFETAMRKVVMNLAIEQLKVDPKLESRNLKTLRPNPAAQREIRLLGRYRVLFDVDDVLQTVTIKVVGEKRGNALFVRGQEYKAHHETDLLE